MLVVDGDGWHGGKNLVVPDAISLLTAPPYASQRNELAVEARHDFGRSRFRA